MEPTETPAADAPATVIEQAKTVLSKEIKPGAPEGPKDGDFVAHCAHITESKALWYWCEDTNFKLGDVSGRVDWLCICEACEQAVGADASKAILTGLGVFQSQPRPTLLRPEFVAKAAASAEQQATEAAAEQPAPVSE